MGEHEAAAPHGLARRVQLGDGGPAEYDRAYERASHYEQLNYEVGRPVAIAALQHGCPVVQIPAAVAKLVEGEWIDFLKRCSGCAIDALPLTAVAR